MRPLASFGEGISEKIKKFFNQQGNQINYFQILLLYILLSSYVSYGTRGLPMSLNTNIMTKMLYKEFVGQVGEYHIIFFFLSQSTSYYKKTKNNLYVRTREIVINEITIT